MLSIQARTRDTATVFLAEGLSDDIAARLGQLAGLTVRSREAVRRLRNADALTVQQLGRTLAAAYVLSGSMRPAGNGFRFVFELTRSQTGAVAWAGTLDRSNEQLLDLQSEVGIAVARVVMGSLTTQDERALAAGSARSSQAFAHVARGTAFLARRLVGHAVPELNAAVRLDPTSAVAWARLSQAYALCDWFNCVPGRDTPRLRARAAADRALGLDSAIADAWLADGIARLFSPLPQADLPRSVASFRRAETLEPRNAEVLHMLGSTLSNMGQHGDAVRYQRAALAIDPDKAITYITLGREAWSQGQYLDAIALEDTAEALERDLYSPERAWRAIVALADTARIRGAWARLAASRPHRTGMAGVALQRRLVEDGLVALAARDTTRAHAAADSLVAIGDDHRWATVLLVRLRRMDDAGKLIRERWPAPGWATWIDIRSPAFTELRAVPEFQVYLATARRLATESPR